MSTDESPDEPEPDFSSPPEPLRRRVLTANGTERDWREMPKGAATVESLYIGLVTIDARGVEQARRIAHLDKRFDGLEKLVGNAMQAAADMARERATKEAVRESALAERDAQLVVALAGLGRSVKALNDRLEGVVDEAEEVVDKGEDRVRQTSSHAIDRIEEKAASERRTISERARAALHDVARAADGALAEEKKADVAVRVEVVRGKWTAAVAAIGLATTIAAAVITYLLAHH